MVGSRGPAGRVGRLLDDDRETTGRGRRMSAHPLVPAATGALPAQRRGPACRDRSPSPVPGGELLALASSLRARGLRGLDVLRRSQDRAPPPSP